MCGVLIGKMMSLWMLSTQVNNDLAKIKPSQSFTHSVVTEYNLILYSMFCFIFVFSGIWNAAYGGSGKNCTGRTWLT